MNNLPLTISSLQEGLKKKKFSSVEIVDKYLKRINNLNPKLNAFLTVSEKHTYKQAKKIDRLIKNNPDAFKEFPLLGTVVAYKDLFLTKGIRTTAGSRVLNSFIPQYSATVVKRLEKAGCLTIGKTNQDAWGHGSSGENSDFGPTKNPWNTNFVPGGSSSGSAVAVAASLTTIATGTDTGSSVRLPASFTNTVALKPTYGAVSRYGIIAMASSLDSIGHITRTVEDCERVFAITKGKDTHDSTTVNQKQKKLGKKPIIGIPKEYFTDNLNKDVKKLTLQAIEVFKGQGIEIKEISLPHTKYGISVYYIIMPAEVSSNLARFDGIRFGNDREYFGEEAKRRIMLGSYVLSTGYYDAYYLKAMKVRTKIREDFANVFKKVDAILAPVSPAPPFKIGERTKDPLQMYLSDILTVTANLAGIPALAIPAGFTDSNLPIGFQLMGDRFSENTLFTLGKLYQAHTNWHSKTPNL